MKKVFILFLFVCLSLFTSFTTAAYAVESPTPSMEASASATPSATAKYDLPFPGMLPDSPFYKLKVARDKIIEYLIKDPSKKIDFYLKQTDKGILATAMLIDKNNITLANQTALRAENNFTLLSGEIPKLSTKPNEEFFTKLKTAALKHQEVLGSLIQRVPSDQQETLKNVLEFSKSNLATIEKLEKKNPQRWNLDN